MEPKKELEIQASVRQDLVQIAFELEAAALGARRAAESIPDRDLTMPNIQQLYARLGEAKYLLDRLKRMIDDAVIERGSE